MPKRPGIVGSWEKDVVGNDLSLEKFKRTGCVEVFCPASEFIDFSMGEEMPVGIDKGSRSWRGEIIGSRTGVLNDMFTPRDFAQAVGKNPVRVHPDGIAPDRILPKERLTRNEVERIRL